MGKESDVRRMEGKAEAWQLGFIPSAAGRVM